MASRIPTDWRICRADEIKATADSAIAIGPFGSRMKTDCYTQSGVPVIRGNNISDTKSFTGDFVYVSPETAATLRSSNVYDGDLVFPHRGLIGEVGIVTGGSEAHYLLSTSLMKLTVNREIVDPLFLFYYFRSPRGKHELLKNASQVGTPGIAAPLASLRSAEVMLPPLAQQRSIAQLLSTLDNKIELNRRMNETLEAIAQALFKSWFVDSTQNGLPEGWYETTVGNICEFAYGRALKEEIRQPGSVPVYGSNGQVGWHNEPLVKGPGIVVGRKGNPGVVTWSATDFFPIDTTFYIVPKSERRSLYFLFFTLSRIDLASLSADSAVPGLNRNIAYMSEVVIPPQDLLYAFDNHVRPLFERIQHNNEESRTVAMMRDALLPKLLSGKIVISGRNRREDNNGPTIE